MDLVRSSCASFRSSLARCSEEQAKRFAREIDPKAILSFVHSSEGLSTNRFDSEVDFPTPDDEVGFILIAHGLDFGSGFRYLLHEHRAGQGAWLTIRAGLVKLGQRNPRCEANWLVSLTLDDIVEIFDLSAESLRPLAQQLFASIHEIGQQLIALGYSTPGEFVMNHLTTSATTAVFALVNNFPLTFKDEYDVITLGGDTTPQHVCFYKKAQLVVSEMNMLFGNRYPHKFSYSDINQLTAFVDNVVVAMLRMNRIVLCHEDLAVRIEKGVYLMKGSEEEVALRSAALAGVEIVVQELRKVREERGDESEEINSQKLCNWLWGCLGKEGIHRKYPRHLCPSTSFY
eukprot:gene6154-6621_t